MKSIFKYLIFFNHTKFRDNDDDSDLEIKGKDDFLILEKINKMVRKDVKGPINSVARDKKKDEVLDETRMIQKKLILAEKSLQNENDVLEFEREKVKNADYNAVLSLQRSQENISEVKKESFLKKFISNSQNMKTSQIIKDFNNDLAYVTKLKKIDREKTDVEDVKNMQYEFKVEKLVKQANFKQTEVFQNDQTKFHFLTPTKAYECSKTEKFIRAPFLFDSSTTSHHQRSKTSYRIKTGNANKRPLSHAKYLLQLTENQINSCKSAKSGPRFRVNTATSLFSMNNDYSVLFSHEFSNNPDIF